MSGEELFQKLRNIAELYADFPLSFNLQEKKAAVDLAKKYGAELLLRVWDLYQEQKPGKPFRYFLEDFGEYRKKYEDLHLSTAEYFARQEIAYVPYQAPPLNSLLETREKVSIPGMRKVKQRLLELQQRDLEAQKDKGDAYEQRKRLLAEQAKQLGVLPAPAKVQE